MNVVRIIQAEAKPVRLVHQGGVTYYVNGDSSLPVSEFKLTRACAVAISGGRLVRSATDGLHYYDATAASDAYTLLGISLQAGAAGGLIELAGPGLVTHPGWGLTPGQTYLAGPAGLLTTDPNGLAFQQIIGQAVRADTLNFCPQSPIFSS